MTTIYDKKTLDEKYREAAQILARAKLLMADEMTDQEQMQVNAYLQQAEDIQKEAERAEQLMRLEEEIADRMTKRELEAEAEARRKKTQEAGFTSFSEYVKAMHDWYTKHTHDPRLESLLVDKAMAGEIGVDGGFLIPEAPQGQLLQTRAEGSFMRPRARIVPMASRSVPFPAVDYSTATAGVSGFFGGVRTYYTEENTNIEASEPSFKMIELKAKELAGYTEIPNGLLRDSAISIEAFLSGPGSFGGALAWQEDYDSLNGTGEGRPLGILHAPARYEVARTTRNKFAFKDAVAMASRLILNGSPVWLMSQTVMTELFQMIDGASNNIWQPNAAAGPASTLLGWPIIFTEKLPALGTTGDVCLVDYSWYLWGDRQAVTMDISREHKFRTNQTVFRTVEAIDGQPWLDSTITLADGSTVVSPFVVLQYI
jgi:HK97 family phage major capsid protein